ncbi:MAG: PD40 domain-containing protein [Planctomycetes bacterium]|nr:PD40 domain-containing protein [Planctomycetota bacterium]
MKQTRKKIVWLAAFLAVGSIPVFAKPFAVGPYLGQTPPGFTPQVFAPGLICHNGHGRWETHGHFSADGNTFCFARSRRVFITENTNQGWTVPKRIKSIPYKIWSPCLSPDANSIYFVARSSTRSIQNNPSKRASLRRCIRTSKGWSLPEKLGPPFSEPGLGFSVAADNSIYFISDRMGPYRNRFWVAPFVGHTWSEAINIPVEKDNLKGCHPGIAPDESFMVFYSIKPGAPGGTETDLYLSLRRADGTWTKPRNMGPGINTGYYEFGARISPDKKYMFFTRSTGWNLRPVSDTGDIYWVELKEYLPESYR